MIQQQTISQINRAKSYFVKQYGENVLNEIRNESLNAYYTLKFYVFLENKFFPTSGDIMVAAAKVEYINKNAGFSFPTPKSVEKKIDYLHISSILILENWAINLLPKQDVNPINLSQRIGNQESGWIFASNTLEEIFKKCDELEKEFNS